METGTDVDMEKVIDKLKQTIPELGGCEFSIHVDPGVLALQKKEFKIFGKKLLLKDLRIKKVDEGKF